MPATLLPENVTLTIATHGVDQVIASSGAVCLPARITHVTSVFIRAQTVKLKKSASLLLAKQLISSNRGLASRLNSSRFCQSLPRS